MKHEIERKMSHSRLEKSEFCSIFPMKQVIILRKTRKLLALFFEKHQSSCKQQIRFSWILVKIVWITILDLVSKSEIEGNFSRSLLEARDRVPEILVSSSCALLE